MKGKFIPWLVVPVLIIGLVFPCFADRKISGDPQPRPWQWGDPDWPAFSKKNVSSYEGLKQDVAPIRASENLEEMRSPGRPDSCQSEQRALLIFGRLGIVISIRR